MDGGTNSRATRDRHYRKNSALLVSRRVYLGPIDWAATQGTGDPKGEQMKRVIIESPLGSTTDGKRCEPEAFDRNVGYAQRALLDSIRRGEAPFGSHLLYPQVLRDAKPEQRDLGLAMGFAWGAVADLVAVYIDHGITPGMRKGIERAKAAFQRIEYREIGKS